VLQIYKKCNTTKPHCNLTTMNIGAKNLLSLNTPV